MFHLFQIIVPYRSTVHILCSRTCPNQTPSYLLQKLNCYIMFMVKGTKPDMISDTFFLNGQQINPEHSRGTHWTNKVLRK
ncbi:hypothetical protein Hanom_Chr09g00865551 [Helianthus anomalus]